MSDATMKAHDLLERGDVQSALVILRQAERSGDPLAARELAVWFLTGHRVSRDLSAARSLFERAAQLDDEMSAPIARAFIAAGVGGPADWPRVLAMLDEASRNDPDAAAQLQLISAMDLSRSGAPPNHYKSEIVSDEPEVRLFPALFTPAECAYLIHTSTPALCPSVVVDPYTGQQVPHPIRTSSAAAFPFVDENPAIHALNRRLAAASGTDVRAGEPLQVLSYAPGQQYREHSDALPHVAPDQQRVLTFLVYLNDDYEGGETAFPAAGTQVRGRTGDGLLFRNASLDGTPDQRAIHAGLPVTRGVKLIASRWIRATPLILE